MLQPHRYNNIISIDHDLEIRLDRSWNNYISNYFEGSPWLIWFDMSYLYLGEVFSAYEQHADIATGILAGAAVGGRVQFIGVSSGIVQCHVKTDSVRKRNVTKC